MECCCYHPTELCDCAYELEWSMSISFVIYPAGGSLSLQSTGGCVRNISTLMELDQLAHHAPLHLRVELRERE